MGDKKELQLAIISLTVLTILVTFCIVTQHVFAFSSNKRVKTFMSIQIEEGDTLWSIAKTYRTEEYKDIRAYIEEIKTSNGIQSDVIHEGNYLIIPYYISEDEELILESEHSIE